MREGSLFALALPLMTGLFGALLVFVLAPASLLIWSVLPLLVGLVATVVLFITLCHIVKATRQEVLEELRVGQAAASPPAAVSECPWDSMLSSRSRPLDAARGCP